MHGMSLFTPVSVTQSLCFLLFAEHTDSCFLNLHLYSYIPEAQITGRRIREGAVLPLGFDAAFVPRSIFFARPPSCSCPKSSPSFSSWGFSFQVQFPSVLKLFFSFIFFPTSISASSRILSCQLLLSSLLPLSFLWIISLILSFFFPVTLHPPPFPPSPSIPQISSYHHRFHFLCHFLYLPAFTLLYSAPTVEQMKNTTLKRPLPPMFSACLLQNSRAS